MRNLLETREERVFFKDLQSRFILVSDGWLDAFGGGHTLEDVVVAHVSGRPVKVSRSTLPTIDSPVAMMRCSSS